MLDDLRNHAAAPTGEESAWMQTSALALLARTAALATVALFIGVTASIALESPQEAPRLVATSQK